VPDAGWRTKRIAHHMVVQPACTLVPCETLTHGLSAPSMAGRWGVRNFDLASLMAGGGSGQVASTASLTTMQCRHEHHIVTTLDLVGLLAL
jgi:hypothetical protein